MQRALKTRGQYVTTNSLVFQSVHYENLGLKNKIVVQKSKLHIYIAYQIFEKSEGVMSQ